MKKIYLFSLLFGLFFNMGEPLGATQTSRYWGENLIGLSMAREKGVFRETPVIVAIIDTGFDFSWKEFHHTIYLPKKSDKLSEQNFGLDFSLGKIPTTTPKDELGHGTHVLGTIHAIAPKAKFLILKYYNAKASATENLEAIIAAFNYALNAGVDFINFSGGGEGLSQKEFDILKHIDEKNILLITAAGNGKKNLDNEKEGFYPASYNLKNILTVTAITQKLELLPEANWGKESVDVAAPGEQILGPFLNRRYRFLSGTSQATAYVTGLAALLKSRYPTLKVSLIKSLIMNNSLKVDKLKEVCHSSGIINLKAALDNAKTSSL